jgi:selenocysteine-specific elongation factor
MSYTVGTAGHVDHGKSTLVRALTGIDPDRLAEEKARSMTIDLGFSWLTLPGGEQVGIVDVPGHRDFIDNMLAGVGGIDLALFVVAADEGVMPQTKEHLAILDLLEVPGGVIALTKCDTVDEPDWIEMVSLDVFEAVSQTVLAKAPIIPVSARTGWGLDDLLAALETALGGRPPRPDRGKPRLPVDRVFTISGFGTVVTGTLSGGSLAVGNEIEIVSSARKARIRGLQSHKEAVERAAPGSRVAVNLGGISKDEIKRGDVLASPGLLATTNIIDTHFRYLADAGRPLKHNMVVKYFCGTAETVAHVRLLGDEELSPGSKGWLQLRLEEPLAIDKGDRFILRCPSPPQTLGGGVVLDPHPPHRWRRFKPEVLARLQTLINGTAEDVLLQAIEGHPAEMVQHLPSSTGLEASAIAEALAALEAQGDVLDIADGWVISHSSWVRLSAQIVDELRTYHEAYPLRVGMPREALRSRLDLEGRPFGKIIDFAIMSGLVGSSEAVLYLTGHTVRFNEAEQAAVSRLWEAIRSAPASPPGIKEATALVGTEVLQTLFEQGSLVQIGPDVLLETGTYQELARQVEIFISEQGSITVAQTRDLFGTSRKYALALLEHLDTVGKTRRVGDQRVLPKRA